MDIDSVFGDMQGAKIFGKGEYVQPGIYLVKAKTIKINNGFKGKSFIFEFEFVESNNEKHKVGSIASWVVKLDKTTGNPWGDVKSLMFALTGTDPNKVGSPDQNPTAHADITGVTKAAVDEATALKAGLPKDFLVGKPVRLNTFMKKTKTGGDFTVHNWQPA